MFFLQNSVLKKVRKEGRSIKCVKKKEGSLRTSHPRYDPASIYSGIRRLQESTGHGGGSTRTWYWEQTSGFKSSIRVQCRKSIATSNSTVISTTKSTHKAKLHKNVCLLPFLLGGNKEYIYAWKKGRGHTKQQVVTCAKG